MSDGIVADEWQTAVPNSSINRSSGRGGTEATGLQVRSLRFHIGTVYSGPTQASSHALFFRFLAAQSGM